MKGILKVNKQIILINAVQKVFHEPIDLKTWPFKDNYSKIVFITKGLKKDEILKTLKVLNFQKEKPLKKSQLSFSKNDYSNFVDCMNKFEALTTLDRHTK